MREGIQVADAAPGGGPAPLTPPLPEEGAGGPVNLLGLSLPELEAWAVRWGQPPYRGRQVFAWLHRRDARSIGEMTDLPRAFRESLAGQASIPELPLLVRQVSADGTEKYLFQTGPGQSVEAVLIPEGPRRTACISTQIGCGMGCTFCATGLMGLVRNLDAAEIVGQVRAVQRLGGHRLTNIVLMGMGEPLANYKHVMKALRIITDPAGLGFSPRRITVSTVGLVPQIRRLAEEGLPLGLAVSLHAPNDGLRDQLVPVNRRWPVAEVMEACRYFVARTGRRITFEYTLLAGVNDSPPLAHELAGLLRGLLCHVNLIPVNPVEETGFQRPSPRVVSAFARVLRERGIPCSVRKERGTDIEAACGQLRRVQAGR